MNICLISLSLAAPLAGAKRRRTCHDPEYRRTYLKAMREREKRHGPVAAKTKGSLLKTVQGMTQSEVARALGISREAVRQTENRALKKIRAALLPLYRELCS